MALSKPKPISASKPGRRKAELFKPVAGMKLKLDIKEKNAIRKTAFDKTAHMFPFETHPSVSLHKSAIPTSEDPDMRHGGRERAKNGDLKVACGSNWESLLGSVNETELKGVYALNVNGAVSSSSTIRALSSPQSQQPTALATRVHADIYSILSALRGSAVTQIELPSLQGQTDSNEETPYTAQFLAHLYLLCYKDGLWNLCDLVADTWIRALQRASRHESEQHRIWRDNPALLAIQAVGKKGFQEDAPEYFFDVKDPFIDPEVVRFDENILNQLYEHTAKDCGARFLWADAMALCGSKLEDTMQQMARYDLDWHPDLVFDIMCTSLRMVRRKLTLKIEEGTEGAWCKRYHEHGKHGQPCYRELAWREKSKQRGEEGENETAGTGARKRKRRDKSVAARDESSAKRVRFEGGSDSARGISAGGFGDGDIDAEGESEEE
jgi:hypothetical protein